MLIQQKIGNINSIPNNLKTINWLVLQWHETGKRIMHKKTKNGVEISMKFMGENQQLTQGDILWEDDKSLIVVDVDACDVIIIEPKTMAEMASICYEIGNKHLPLFYQEEKLLVAYEAPLFKMLSASGYVLNVSKQKLLNQLKTTVSPHSNNNNNGSSLFSKIMQLTNPNE